MKNPLVVEIVAALEISSVSFLNLSKSGVEANGYAMELFSRSPENIKQGVIKVLREKKKTKEKA